MALIRCSECGRNVSNKAYACPNCGCLIENIKRNRNIKRKRQITITGTILMLILLGSNFILYKNNWSIQVIAETISIGNYFCLLGHDWKEATCEISQTCLRCGCIQGDALGHDWIDATCESPQICLKCDFIQSEALGHKWKNATCESPKMCERCQRTKGNPLRHTRAYGTCDRCGLSVNEFRR